MLKCSSCGHLNPDNSAYCQKCASVLGAVRKGYSGPAPQPGRKNPRAPAPRFIDPSGAAPGTPPVAWNWKPFWWIGWFFAGLALLISGTVIFKTLGRRTSWGSIKAPLAQHFFEYAPFRYYTIEKCSAEIYTVHNNQQDLALEGLQHNDSGTLMITTLSSSANRQTLLIQSADWTTVEQTRDGQKTTAVSPEDPSLAPATAVLDKPGYVMKYDSAGSWRLGKALHILLPVWPPTHQPGDSWNESVEWNDWFGEWEIHWNGILTWTWTLPDSADASHVSLTVRGKLTPTLQTVPRWARRSSRGASFDGSAQGDALYDPAQRRVVSNAFHYSGTLLLPLNDLNTVPAYRRFDQYSGEAGAIAIVFQNDVAIGLP